MIRKIKTHSVLSNFVEDTCSENGICVTFDEGIAPDSYVIIKVDKYYNSLKVAKRPASIDCLIVRECVRSGFGLTLVELKNIGCSRGFDANNVKEKFETTLYDFIKKKFRDPLDIQYSEIKLFFVSKQEIYKRDMGLKMEFLINTRFKFNGCTLMINPIMPDPTIKKCYFKKTGC